MNEFKQIALDNLQKQFGYTNLSDLLMKRAAVWDKNFGDVAQRFENDILNLDTCDSTALDYFWGKIYRITRTFEDENGNPLVLSDEMFREILKIKAFGCRWDGTVAQMNEFLKNLFADRGFAYVIDKQDMDTEIFAFGFTLTDEERYLFKNKDILPRPAGIGVSIFELGDDLLGFYGSDFLPFNDGVFFDGEI